MQGCLRLAGFTRESVVDGPGLRAVVFAQGCPHRCRGCQNPSTWDYEGGYVMKIGEILDLIQETRLLRGVTFSGGEPFVQAGGFAELAQRVKKLGLDVATYTGFTFEELLEKANDDSQIMELLRQTDILIDGPFREEEKDLTLAFRGSRNQRIIDVKRSFASGRVVVLDYP